MRNILEKPVALLLLTGFLLGLNFPLGKIAGQAHISPMVWAMVVSLGASLLLLPVIIRKPQARFFNAHMVRYIMLSGLISYIIPNLLIFNVIQHVGAGYMGLMFALSPVFTLLLAVLFQVRVPNLLGICGILFGLVGASVISIYKGSGPDAPALDWLLAAVFVPVCLACGNIYRTLDWPKGTLPDALAFWSHTFAVAFFLLVILLLNGSDAFVPLAHVPATTLAQLIVSGLTFPFFFRLQEKGGPVLLSQIGYVAAAVSLLAATFVLGEFYSLPTWLGAGIIAIGIAITIVAQRPIKPH